VEDEDPCGQAVDTPSSHLIPNGESVSGGALSGDRSEFYRARYLAAVEEADALRHELSIAQSQLRVLYDQSAPLREHLKLMETQCALYKEANERSIVRCNSLDEACARMREELMESSVQIERLKKKAERFHEDATTQAALVKDLRAKLARAEKSCADLEGKNTSLTMQLGQHTAAWSREKKSLVKERDEAIAKLKELLAARNTESTTQQSPRVDGATTGIGRPP
jgi:chromosome segregation ATPase